MPTQDEQDYKDYQDYLEYQNHLAASGAKRAPATDDGYGPVQTALETGLNSTLGGYTPQIAGAASALTGGDYVQGRDAQAGRLAEMSKQNPASSVVGNTAGGVLGFLGVGKVLKGIGLAGKAAQATGAVEKAASIGRTALQGLGVGAAQGALVNPGETPGEVSWVQPGARAVNAGVGAAMGGSLGALAGTAAKGAELANNVDLVKNAPKLLAETQSRLARAIGTLKGKVTANEAPLQEALAGKTVSISPDELAGLTSKARNSLTAGTEASPLNEALQGKAAPSVSLKAPDALVQRRQADDLAGWLRSKGADEAAHAGKNEQADLANLLRSKLEAVDPRVAPIQSESAGIYNNLNHLESLKARPIEGIQTKPATTSRALLQNADEAAGSDLAGFGDRIKTAKDYLIDPSNLLKPLELPNTIKKGVVRGAASLGRQVNKSKITREQLNQAVLNATIGNKRGKTGQ